MTEFPPHLPHGDLREVFPDVFFVSGQSRPVFNGTAFQFSRNMTVVRDGGALTLVNTLRLDDAGLAGLEALGTVENIVRLGAFHGRDDAFYIDRYGAATFWAPDGMGYERGETPDKALAPGQPSPCKDATVFAFETSDVPEAILRLDRQGGILISCDSLQNWAGPDEHFDDQSAAMMRDFGFFHPANIGPGWMRSASPEPSDFTRLMEMDYRHLLSAHGAPLLDDAKPAIGATIQRVFG